jgi:predicted AAA+ superfamily ATPase
MIERSVYLNKLIKSKENGFPKVITGIRRCGKSYLLKEIYKKYLIETGVKESNILVLELDEEENSKYSDPIYLGDFVRNFCNHKSMCYVFLDEIQKVIPIVNPVLTNDCEHIKAKDTDEDVISFVDVVLGLSHKPNIDLYVTGSNSKMLSKNIITEFRDKATNISIYPLSFEEYYNYVGGSTTDAMFEYMQHGGMPLAVLKDEDDKEEYLKGLFETSYFKDILEHKKLYKSESLDELCNIISELTGSLLNSKKISDTFKSVKHEDIDKQTIDKYIEYLKDAFILREARRYDLKRREEIGALQKYYFTDTGLRNARLNFAFPDEGQMLENVVYNELIYNGYTVNVGTFESIEKNKDGKSVRKTNEVDFYATKNKKRLYIQVSKDISNEKTMNRELSPFHRLNDQIQKVVVINKPIKETFDKDGYTIIGVADFLLIYIK